MASTEGSATDPATADAHDPLRAYRDAFTIPNGVIYLDGNSLGPPTRAAATRLAEFVDRQWGDHLIGAWDKDGWIDVGTRLGAQVARLVGARSDEVVVTDSTSVNLYKLLHAALSARPTGRIVAAADDFPTDRYIVDAVAGQRHRAVVRVDPDDIPAGTLDGAAVVALSHVHYRTGRIHDLDGITGAAHAAGALALWDLSHSVGALPIDLAGAGADLAVGCTYKFLNGGPGAPAFAFVARAHHAELDTPITGWLGHADPFAFDAHYQPARGVERLVTGTPAIAAHLALETALEVWRDVDLAMVRAKAIGLSRRFLTVVEDALPGVFDLRSPRDPSARGNHLALAHPEGYRIIQALIARGVVGDFRAPDVLRFGFASLYLGHQDVVTAAHQLVDVVRSRAWEDPTFARQGKVT